MQDEIQGFHCCTFHPVILYYKQGGELLSHSICYISDDLTHDVDFVVSETVTFVKNFLLNNISQVFYFTDGCAGQYKNRKNFLNLCRHLEDFQIKAKWCFFATSHGKSPCDGIGRTLKIKILKLLLSHWVISIDNENPRKLLKAIRIINDSRLQWLHY